MKNYALILLALALATGCKKSEEASINEALNASTKNSTSTSATYTVTTEAALKSAIASAVAGDQIKVSGTIYLTSTLQLLNSGTSSSKINFTTSNGGILDCSGISSGWGVKVNGSYWNITNLTIRNAPDCGIVLQHGGYNYLAYLKTHNNKDSGIQIYNGSNNNNVFNCQSYDNYDVANGGENADGFACKLSGGANNKFESCTANHNSDDGWDLYGQPYTVKIINCTATNNGFGTNGDGNGFKLGSAGQNVPHTVTGCTASYNLKCGYDGNGNTGTITKTGSGGTGNGQALWYRVY